MCRHVGDEIVLLARGAAPHVPEAPGLNKFVVFDVLERGVDGGAGLLLVRGRGGRGGLVNELAVRAGVVGVGAVVAVDGHGAVALEGVEGRRARAAPRSAARPWSGRRGSGGSVGPARARGPGRRRSSSGLSPLWMASNRSWVCQSGLSEAVVDGLSMGREVFGPRAWWRPSGRSGDGASGCG